MKNLGALISALIFATVLSACGNSGDPGKKYSAVNAKTSVKVDPNATVQQPATPVMPVAPPAPQNFDCNNPFEVKVEKATGNQVLFFTENTETTYTIRVHSKLGIEFKVETANPSPILSSDLHSERAKFTQIDKSGTNATYTLTWKPAKSRTSLNLETLDIKYTSSGNAVCNSSASETLNLLVQDPKTGEAK